jgi:translation initiation factor 2 beta subunit (eIF-2beta)/eIF-5
MEKCPVCGSKKYNLRESFGGFLAMHCSNCGFDSAAKNQKDFETDIINFKKLKNIWR